MFYGSEAMKLLQTPPVIRVSGNVILEAVPRHSLFHPTIDTDLSILF